MKRITHLHYIKITGKDKNYKEIKTECPRQRNAEARDSTGKKDYSVETRSPHELGM